MVGFQQACIKTIHWAHVLRVPLPNTSISAAGGNSQKVAYFEMPKASV